MLIELFFKGILIGLILGIPVGAIGALTIQRTLDKGMKGGLISGAGSCTADLFFAIIGVFGVTIVSDFLEANERWIELIGGIFIIALGLSIYLKKKELKADSKKDAPYHIYFMSSFGAAILNPATMVAFMIAFTSFDITDFNHIYEAIVLLVGIISGTFSWWLILCGLVSLFREKINGKIYKLINYVLGTIVLVFGVVITIQGIVGVARH